MAARNTLYCTSKLSILFRRKNSFHPPKLAILQVSSIGLLSRALLAKHQCKVNDVCEGKGDPSASTPNNRARIEFKEKCYHIRKLCDSRKLEEASEIIDELILRFKEKDLSFTSVCNCALYHAVKNKNDILAERILSNMKKTWEKRYGATYHLIAFYSLVCLMRK